MGNRRTSHSASKRSSSRKGTTKGKGTKGRRGSTGRKGSTKAVGGSRQRRGWSGPVGDQVRGSNTRTKLQHPKDPKEEDGGRGQSHPKPSEAQRGRQAPAREPAPRGKPPAARTTEAHRDGPPRQAPQAEPQAGPKVTVVEGDVHGPERIEDLRSRADQMVIGERTVIHHAARYGIVRGMTWTVILSALLFWLPVAGPAIAGYVGGRKAGGPLRGIIAVAIPAVVMLVVLAALSEGYGILPSSVVGGGDIDIEGLGELPTSAVPILGSLKSSIESWIASPPDLFFIMAAFAVVGGALSSLRRREEETVIEKVGIPLGELKERILKEEAEKGGTGKVQLPSKWHPHRMISGPAAAHDALNEMVEDIVHRVVVYMQTNDVMVEEGKAPPTKARSRARAKDGVSVGGEGPHFDDMVQVVQTSEGTSQAPKPRRSRRGATAGKASPRTAKEAIVGDEEDWTVVDTSKGRRPVRVVHSPAQERTARARTVRDAERSPPAQAQTFTYIPEPEMHIEKESRGLFRRPRQRVVYSPPESTAPADLLEQPSTPLGSAAGSEALEDEVPARPRRNFERLPIIGPIMESVEHGQVGISGKLTSLDEPSVDDTLEAGAIGESAARELAEMARFEEGPDMVPGDDLTSPEARAEVPVEAMGIEEEVEPALSVPEPKPRKGPKAKPVSKARKVKHPTGALKSRGRPRHADEDVSYEEDMAETGEVQWEAPDQVEEEDMFNPRHLEDDDGSGEADQEAGDAWAEEERIAALVREREEWDRL